MSVGGMIVAVGEGALAGEVMAGEGVLAQDTSSMMMKIISKKRRMVIL